MISGDFICLVCDINVSNHQTTNLVFPNFFHEFFSVWAVEKANFLLVQNRFFFLSVLDQWKGFFFFLNCSTEKISWKKLGKTRFVVWSFDVTNWLLLSNVWAFFLVFHNNFCWLVFIKNLNIFRYLRLYLHHCPILFHCQQEYHWQLCWHCYHWWASNLAPF